MRLLIIGLLVCLLSLTSTVQADQLDDLKKVIEEGHYTIEYDFKREQSLDIKRDKGTVTKTGIESVYPESLQNESGSYLIVNDGENFYVSSGDRSNSQLRLGNKIYFSATDTRGRNLSRVRAFHPNFNRLRYGDDWFDTAIMALFPEKITDENSITAWQKSGKAIGGSSETGIPKMYYVYKRAGSGINEEGLTYFDLKAETDTDNRIDAIRYYFDGDRLVKIKMAVVGSYGEYLGDKKYAYNTSITIKNFSTIIDRSLFTPPDMSASRKSIQQALNEQQMESRRHGSWLGF